MHQVDVGAGRGQRVQASETIRSIRGSSRARRFLVNSGVR